MSPSRITANCNVNSDVLGKSIPNSYTTYFSSYHVFHFTLNHTNTTHDRTNVYAQITTIFFDKSPFDVSTTIVFWKLKQRLSLPAASQNGGHRFERRAQIGGDNAFYWSHHGKIREFRPELRARSSWEIFTLQRQWKLAKNLRGFGGGKSARGKVLTDAIRSQTFRTRASPCIYLLDVRIIII